MIEEFVRPMSAEERESLEHNIRPMHDVPVRYTLGTVRYAVVGLAVSVVAAVVLLLMGPRFRGFGVAVAGGGLYFVQEIRKAFAERRELRRRMEMHQARRHPELARALEDGRVAVKRVRAVAVVQIEPMEDEGTGYLFDLGDGRVLALKGADYSSIDGEAELPSSEFDIVRLNTDRTLLGVYCRGQALTPLRVIDSDEYDPEEWWSEREEVLNMSLDDAVRTVVTAA